MNLAHGANKGRIPQIFIRQPLDRRQVLNAIQRILRVPTDSNTQYDRFANSWNGRPFLLEVKPDELKFVTTDPPLESVSAPFGSNYLPEISAVLAKNIGNPFRYLTFKRLLADRDVLPEVDEGSPEVLPNGEGTTRTIEHFLNKRYLPSHLVEQKVLLDLNKIFEPDGSFSRLLVQQLENGRWEIYLQEEQKGPVPLSQSGSGVKTVLLVLAFVHLIPHLENNQLSQYLFGFEELENNLHPALQRRLLLYLRTIAAEERCRFFLTTHSSVAIDLFANDEHAQIIHVSHGGDCASVKSVLTFNDSRNVLDELDVRASDLLQSNGLVWVEGPSDRLYFNRWIELMFEGSIKENAHYQCLYYGGSLLAHFSADDPDVNANNAVKVLRVNRNAIMLLDSDRSRRGDELNDTKNRIIAEVVEIAGMAWVTDGRTIENYLPDEAIRSRYGISVLPRRTRFSDFSIYLDRLMPGEGRRFLKNKTLFAEKMLPHITKQGIEETLDLANQVRAAGELIKRWNGIV